MSSLVPAAAATLCVSGLLTPLVTIGLRRRQVLDLPSHRSAHSVPTPRGGGLAPGIACLVGLAVLHPSTIDSLALGGAGLSYGILGLVDDLRDLGALPRLVIQVAVAAVLVPLVLRGTIANALAAIALGVVAALWIVGFVNAFNFMDGINGMAVAQATVAGLVWTFVGWAAGAELLKGAGIVVAVAAAGFAPANVPRAKVFLGDVGSYFLGAWLATAAVLAIKAGVPVEAVLAPLTVFVGDFGWTIVSRAGRVGRFYEPHQCHVYQRLVALGWSHVETSSFAASVMTAAGALGAVSLTHSLASRMVADLALLAVVALYLSSPALVERRRSRRDGRSDGGSHFRLDDR